MSSAESFAEPPVQPERSIFQVLVEGFRFYFKHAGKFTVELILPILMQLGGVFCASLLPIYGVNYALNTLNITEPILLVLMMALLMIPGFYLLFKGFWDYMVYMVSFNLNIVQLQRGEPFDVAGAYHEIQGKSGPYTMILLLFTVILLVPCLGFLLPSVLPLFWGGLNWLFASALGFLLGGVLSVGALLLAVYFCLPIQVLAFESVTMNPVPTFKRSYALVKGHFWQTFFLTLVLGLVTSMMVPMMVATLLDMLHLIEWFSKACMEGLMTDLVKYTVSPDLSMVRMFDDAVNVRLEEVRKILEPIPGGESLLFNQSFSFISILTQTLVSFVVQVVVAAFLMPLGTTCYCFLYQELVMRENKGSSNTTVPDEAGQTSFS